MFSRVQLGERRWPNQGICAIYFSPQWLEGTPLFLRWRFGFVRGNDFPFEIGYFVFVRVLLGGMLSDLPVWRHLSSNRKGTVFLAGVVSVAGSRRSVRPRPKMGKWGVFLRVGLADWKKHLLR